MQALPVITKDGSHTIHLADLDVTYHSVHGALTESRHVFIDAGLQYRLSLPYHPPLQILEMGFGTGLNALLSLERAEMGSLPFAYTGIEAYPLSDEIVDRLNYVKHMKRTGLEESFKELHQAPFEKEIQITPHFIFKKIKSTIQEALPQWVSCFDLIYYDAFAPLSQPELWTPAIFNQLFDSMRPGGILVTYCSKGDVRRAMQGAGFEVWKLPGPPGKREMLRAVRI